MLSDSLAAFVCFVVAVGILAVGLQLFTGRVTRYAAIQWKQRGLWYGFAYDRALEDDDVWRAVNGSGGLILMLTALAVIISLGVELTSSGAGTRTALSVCTCILLVGLVVAIVYSRIVMQQTALKVGLVKRPGSGSWEWEEEQEPALPEADPIAMMTPRKLPKVQIDLEKHKTYVVQHTDTIALVALKHNLSIRDLMSRNRMSTRIIHPGQVLIVGFQPEPNASASAGEDNSSSLLAPGLQQIET